LRLAHKPSRWLKDEFAQATHTRDPILEFVTDIGDVFDVRYQIWRLGTGETIAPQ
jgi:hypothetical protein